MLFRANNLSTWPAQFDSVFSRLEALQYNGVDRWTAKCPAHEDIKPSLSVAIGDARLLVKCHRKGGGCSFDQIVGSMGLSSSDFREKGSMSKFKECYDYRDENNKLLFQVCRMEDPKSFYQRRPNPAFDPKKPKSKETNPEFINNLEGVRRILFNLPGMLAALKQSPKRWVLILEGEKDCILANRNGLVSTTNPMGALEWKDEYSDCLKGCNVVVIPDNDPVDPQRGFSVGIEHAIRVCKSLEGKASQVVFLELPDLGPKGDFTDWWNHQSRKDKDQASKKAELGALIKNAPTWQQYKEKHAITSNPVNASQVTFEGTFDSLPVAATAQSGGDIQSPQAPQSQPESVVSEPIPTVQDSVGAVAGAVAKTVPEAIAKTTAESLPTSPRPETSTPSSSSSSRSSSSHSSGSSPLPSSSSAQVADEFSGKIDLELVRLISEKIPLNGRVMALGQLVLSYDHAYNLLVSRRISPNVLREAFAALSSVALKIANEAGEICKELS